MYLKFRFQHAMEHGQSWLLEKYFGNRYCSWCKFMQSGENKSETDVTDSKKL